MYDARSQDDIWRGVRGDGARDHGGTQDHFIGRGRWRKKTPGYRSPARSVGNGNGLRMQPTTVFMTWQIWLMFVMTEAVLSITPGPAVLYVLSQAIRRGPGKSVWASWGILSANALYFMLSATSLGAVIVASYKL